MNTYHFFNFSQMHHGHKIIKSNVNYNDFFIIKNNLKKRSKLKRINANVKELNFNLEKNIKIVEPFKYYLYLIIFILRKKQVALHGFDISWFVIVGLMKTITGVHFRAIWICWGGGLKDTSESGFVLRIKGRVAGWLYRRLDLIITLMSPEREALIQYFRCNDRCIKVLPYYSVDKDWSKEDLVGDVVKFFGNKFLDTNLKVIIGNSGAIQLNHKFWINKLYEFSGSTISYWPIVFANYSAPEKYLIEVRSLHQNLFKNSGKCFDCFLSRAEYDAQFRIAHILVQDVSTQLGLGAIYNSVKNGVTIYLRKNSFNAEWLDFLGIKYLLIEDCLELKKLKTLSKNELISNVKAYQKYFSRDRLLREWQLAFNRSLNH